MTDEAVRLFIEALPRRLRFAEVAATLGLKPSHLRAAFEAEGLNPRDCIRQARFSRLHADLLTGRYDDLAEALIRWGFPPGNTDVPGEYSRRFGCRPQQTLDAARARNGLGG